MSRRTEQLSSIIHQAVQGVLTEGLADPRAKGIATITSVKVSDDLSDAVLSVSILPESSEQLFMHALEDASNYIRRRAAERLALHRPPRLVFKLDRSAKKQAALLAALHDIEKERAAEAGTPSEPPTASPLPPTEEPAP